MASCLPRHHSSPCSLGHLDAQFHQVSLAHSPHRRKRIPPDAPTKAHARPCTHAATRQERTHGHTHAQARTHTQVFPTRRARARGLVHTDSRHTESECKTATMPKFGDSLNHRHLQNGCLSHIRISSALGPPAHLLRPTFAGTACLAPTIAWRPHVTMARVCLLQRAKSRNDARNASFMRRTHRLLRATVIHVSTPIHHFHRSSSPTRTSMLAWLAYCSRSLRPFDFSIPLPLSLSPLSSAPCSPSLIPPLTYSQKSPGESLR